MDRQLYPDRIQLPEYLFSPATLISTGIALLYFVYQTFIYFGYPLLSVHELFWNALVFIVPGRLVLDATKRQELKADNMLSQMHAAKSEALRSMIGNNLLFAKIPSEGFRGGGLFSGPSKPTTDAPPGLGNWDNSCYQNSVLQGLASLKSFKPFLDKSGLLQEEEATGTTASLRETMGKLNDPMNNGRQLWTPAKLKSMSSWQQQDAQEYFSKIMDELDKESAKAAKKRKEEREAEKEDAEKTETPEQTDGTKGEKDEIREAEKSEETEEISEEEAEIAALRNPLEGILAQRVACTRCGFSEGLSMIPFNCLTLSLGPEMSYNIGQCLNEYTDIEEISEVDCAKCTLLKAEQSLLQMTPKEPEEKSEDTEETGETKKKTLSLPPEVRAQVAKRLEAIQKAMKENDFADKTLSETCQISKKAHVSSTKTKQAVVGRAPQNLAVHVNRSVFDEMTGMQRKNYASVRYPLILDLGPWVLNSTLDENNKEVPRLSPSGSMLSSLGNDDSPRYRLQSVVTHYGRHENGHYICYRKHATLPQKEEANEKEEETREEKPIERWWRLSDEDVSAVTEEDVLEQGGVFMLFYEREDIPSPLPAAEEASESAPVAEPTEGSLAATEDSATLHADSDDGASSVTLDESGHSTPLSTPTPHSDENTRPKISGADTPMTEATTEDGLEASSEADHVEIAKPNSPTPSMMRTAHGQQSHEQNEGGFGNSMRQMAAT